MCERIPYLILPVRQLSREPFGTRRCAASELSGMTRGPSRIKPSAEAQIRRSDTTVPLGKPLGPSQMETIYASRRVRRRANVEPSAEAPQASRRARRWARLESNNAPKRRSTKSTRASRRASRRAHLK